MRRLRRSRNGGGEAKDLDISPLIDVVFLLLIFFMVTATFVKDMELELERPSASTGAASDAKSLRVYIDRAGQIYVDELPVQAWMVQTRVRDMLRGAPDSNVLVVVDSHVPSQRLIEVVDQCRLAGARDVGVATESEAG
jgi:biopolymer transport protein ExbD